MAKNRLLELAGLEGEVAASLIPDGVRRLWQYSHSIDEFIDLCKGGGVPYDIMVSAVRKYYSQTQDSAESILDRRGYPKSAYDVEKLKQVYVQGRSKTGDQHTLKAYEALLKDLFGDGWPSGMPPHIYDIMRKANSPEEFVKMVNHWGKDYDSLPTNEAQKNNMKNKVELMKEERIRRFKKLIGMNEEMDPMSVPQDAAMTLAEPIEEDGLAAQASSQPAMDPKLDAMVDELTRAIPATIMRMIRAHGLADGMDGELPYMSAYVMRGLMKNLGQEI